jgi:hypothetical protein
MFTWPTKKEALRTLRCWTGQDFGDNVEKWQEWIEENVETFYAADNNGGRYTILISTETAATGEEREVLCTPQGVTIVRIGKGKYQMVSEFYGDKILTTFDPNESKT